MKALSSSIFICFFVLFSLSSYLQEYGQQNDTLRVLTFNILHGATTNGSFDLDKIASVIEATNPDLVAMQEVDFKTRRAKNYDLVTELGWRTKMAPLFGIAMPYDGGSYGEGILTKMPILKSENVALPHSPGNEPRAALSVLVQLKSGDTIRFIGTHLEHQKASTDRIDQVKKINAVFADSSYPSILAGDLNATPESQAIRILKEFWTDSAEANPAPTYSSEKPEKKIDYILYRPANRWEVIETQVICDTIASDHCAVLSVLKLNQ
ncbi:endonuclease/exonuclease/phosphatase family protein [Maribellus mangrovi]|uniref:endonuclease/exonuclease/phosphatase family protein n=1 Tax=Maribellus mangrovi TaxID=3133146 RepID=UPI0030EBB941